MWTWCERNSARKEVVLPVTHTMHDRRAHRRCFSPARPNCSSRSPKAVGTPAVPAPWRAGHRPRCSTSRPAHSTLQACLLFASQPVEPDRGADRCEPRDGMYRIIITVGSFQMARVAIVVPPHKEERREEKSSRTHPAPAMMLLLDCLPDRPSQRWDFARLLLDPSVH